MGKLLEAIEALRAAGGDAWDNVENPELLLRDVRGRQPIRIQRRRTKGWRMPYNTVYVGRPSRWGNPFPIGSRHPWNGRLIVDAADSVRVFKDWLHQFKDGQALLEVARKRLRGRNLACWCDLDSVCHADIYLELVNA